MNYSNLILLPLAMLNLLIGGGKLRAYLQFLMS
jgi:hypothetical protein